MFPLVTQLKVLVTKFSTIDTFTACAITFGEIASLRHKTCDDPMEDRILEMKHLSRDPSSFLSSAQFSEILASSWDYVIEELKNDSPFWLIAYSYVKVDPWVTHGRVLIHFN